MMTANTMNRFLKLSSGVKFTICSSSSPQYCAGRRLTLHIRILLLNAAKTKELIFDFRHSNISHVPLSLLTTRL